MTFDCVIEQASLPPQQGGTMDFIFRWSSVDGQILDEVLPTRAWKRSLDTYCEFNDLKLQTFTL